METQQINAILKNIRTFYGTFPKDMCTHIPKTASVVLNTDPSSRPGQHCVAIVNVNGIGEYFDSYGLPPLHQEMTSLLQKSCIQWSHNSITLQSFNGVTCGQYCCLYIILRNKNISYCDIINLFTNVKSVNDLIAENLIKLF